MLQATLAARGWRLVIAPGHLHPLKVVNRLPVSQALHLKATCYPTGSWRSPAPSTYLAARYLSTTPIRREEGESTEKPPEKPKSGSIFSRLVPSDVSASSFRNIVALARPERRPLTFAVGLLLVSSSVSMSIPFTIGRLIDFFSSSNPQIPLNLSVPQASTLLLVILTIGAAANAGRVMMMRMAGQRIVARLREQTYESALRQEVEYVEKGEGDVLSRLSVDSSIVGESITQNLSDGLRAIVMASVGLGAMLYLSPQLTLMMLGVVPPVSLGAVWYGRYLKKLSNQTQEAVGEMTKVASESLTALRTVQAFNALPSATGVFHDRISKVLDLQRKEAKASAIFFGSTGWSGNVVLVGLLGYGGTLVSQGHISVGDLTSLLMYTVYVGSGLQMLTSFFSSIMRGIGAGTRIFSLLERTPAVQPGKGIALSPERRGVVKFENIEFEYPTRPGVKVLNGLDLTVNVGESVAIVGKSGGGKSSIHSLLLRYYDPVSGKVTFDGQDIRDFTPESWRAIIGVVPQDPIMFAGTIASNIAYGVPDATREQIEAAAREANCEFVWGMPKGFDTEIGRLSLSGGQRQRLAIARALLKKPAILALDEATSSLDATSEHRVNDAIDKILQARQTTCLIVAHRLSTIARAERIVVLEDGRITESGTYRQLVDNKDSRFRVLMAAQLNAAAGQSPVAAIEEAATVESEENDAEEEQRVEVETKQQATV